METKEFDGGLYEITATVKIEKTVVIKRRLTSTSNPSELVEAEYTPRDGEIVGVEIEDIKPIGRD